MTDTTTITAADPVFAAIADHKRAWAARLADDNDNDAPADFERKALNRLFATGATTIAGAVALLRYLHQHNTEARGRLMEEDEGLWACLVRLARELEAIAAAAA